MIVPPSVEIVQVLQPAIDVISGDSLQTVVASCLKKGLALINKARLTINIDHGQHTQ